MKVICHIFVLFVLIMVFYPCSDAKTCADEQKTGMQTSSASHDHSASEEDVCSPFCQCSCCHTQVSQPSFYNFESVNKPATVHKVEHTSEALQSIGHAIWQPPKLS